MTISVLIPAFNASSWIESTLHSCLEQTCDFQLEIVVVDDHSTDDTLEVVRSFAEYHSNIKFILALNPKKGACSARNHALLLSSGDVIQWLDADDILGPRKIQRQLRLLEMHPGYLIASKWRRFTGDLSNLWDEEGGPWLDVPHECTPIEWLLSERMMIPAGWLGTRSLFESIGPWDESLLINQDGEYFTRAIAASKGVVFEPDSRVYYRTEVNASVSTFQPEKAASLFKSVQSFEHVLSALGDSKEIKTLISDQYQGFIYRVYPHVPHLIAQAEEKIKALGRPTRRNDVAASLFARCIAFVLGWKTLVQLRLIKQKV